MSDLISRQAAIDEIDEWIKAFLENGHKESAADACLIQDGIFQLPSVQPERKTGKWIQKSKPMEFNTVWWYECSECGDKPPRDRYGNPDYLSNFCPNCGADMRGEKDGN